MSYGIFEVTKGHTFRDFRAGERFEGRTDRRRESRAVERGVLRFIEPITVELVPGSYVFPSGWLSSPHTPVNRGAERRLF